MKIGKIAIATLASLGVLATGSALLTSQYIAEANAKLTVEEAKSIAFKTANVNAKDVKQYTVKLEKENGVTVYDVEFYVNNIAYDYEIDANSGAIVSSDSEVEYLVIKPDNKTQNNQSNNRNNANYIGVAKAKSIATKDAGVNSNQAKFYTSKFDFEDGRAVYDIEFYVNNVEYDYEIDAITGKIIEKDMDIENFTIPQKNNQNNQSNNQNNTNGLIGIEKAKSIALKHAGVSSVQFTKAKLDTDDGVKVYDVEFRVNGVKYDYEIDAKTGAVRDFDIDD